MARRSSFRAGVGDTAGKGFGTSVLQEVAAGHSSLWAAEGSGQPSPALGVRAAPGAALGWEMLPGLLEGTSHLVCHQNEEKTQQMTQLPSGEGLLWHTQQAELCQGEAQQLSCSSPWPRGLAGGSWQPLCWGVPSLSSAQDSSWGDGASPGSLDTSGRDVSSAGLILAMGWGVLQPLAPAWLQLCAGVPGGGRAAWGH